MKHSLTLSLATLLTVFVAGSAANAAPANVSVAASTHTLGRVPGHRSGMALAPHGAGTILYDQTAAYDGVGAPVVQYSDASLRVNDAAGADDFVVGSSGWTVTGFNFLAFNASLTTVSNLADIYVYADNAGLPAAAPVCTSLGSTNTPSAYDDATTLAAITLNQPCVLDAGTYWVSLAFEHAGGLDGYVPYFWGLSTDAGNGAEGLWRQPEGPACTDWSPISGCFDGVTEHDYAFQVVGTASGTGVGTGDLSLALTAAVDNGDANQCGTSTNLSVDVGQGVNLCYTITNHTGHALSYQTLSDTLGGNVFRLEQQPLVDGASYQFNRLVNAGPSTGGTVTATWSAQDHRPNYTYDDTGSSGFVDITATGTALGLADDGTADVPMPFSFSYYGMTTNQLTISNNGGVIVGVPGATSLPTFNYQLPAALSGPAMVLLWDDFAATTGDVYYDTRGDQPNRQFIVEWYDRVHFNGSANTDGATFELIIDEATGALSYEYNDVDYTANSGGADPAVCNGGLCATIGLQQQNSADSTQSFYTQYSYASDTLSDGQSIVWSPIPLASYTATSTVTLDVGAAVVSAAPGTLAASAAAGTQTTATLTIGNGGNRDLDWTIDETDTAGARAHFPRVPYHAPSRPAGEAGTSSQRFVTPQTGKDGISSNAHDAPSGAAQVPAYAVLPVFENVVAMDAANPSPLTLVGAPSSLANEYDGGAFANNDFSRIYLVGPPANLVIPTSSGFISVDTTSGTITMIDPHPETQTGGIPPSVLQWDASTGTMYASATDNGPPVNPPPGFQPTAYLYTVDLATGTFTPAATLNNVSIGGLAFDAAGNLYGLDIGGDQLIAIDKTTGDWQPIGPIGFDANFAQAMDFDPRSGVLWYAACVSVGFNCNGEMDTLDTATGHATTVAPIDGSQELAAFSIAVPSGPCANPADVPWLSMTPAAGTTASGSTTPVTITFDAGDLAAGTYNANLCVQSNDLSHRVVAVPVAFTVGTGVADRVFADGFD